MALQAGGAGCLAVLRVPGPLLLLDSFEKKRAAGQAELASCKDTSKQADGSSRPAQQSRALVSEVGKHRGGPDTEQRRAERAKQLVPLRRLEPGEAAPGALKRPQTPPLDSLGQ